MLTVTPITESDLPAVVELLEEMDRFYGVTEFEPAEARKAQIRSLLFRGPPAAHVLLARDDDRVMGLAAYSFLWPAVGLTQSLFLKELYVAQACRRQGVGRLLMQRLVDLAAETGCSRVEWMTDQGNVDAWTFYAQIGYKPNTEKVFYRLQEGGLESRQTTEQ